MKEKKHFLHITWQILSELGTMNSGHAKLADWGFAHLPQITPERAVDLGCGGGRNAGELLKKYPNAHVTALDYSELSVEKAKACNKAMIAAGLSLPNYGTVLVSVADEDKEETVPLIRRFYQMGFNIEATSLTGEVLRQHGIRTRIRHKPSEGSEEVLDSIRAGYVSYVINTRAVLSGVHYGDGVAIRRCAAQNNITMLTSLDTVRMVLDVLEEVTLGVSTIDAE